MKGICFIKKINKQSVNKYTNDFGYIVVICKGSYYAQEKQGSVQREILLHK